MTSQEVGLKIALYFAECDKIKATPRMDEITRLIELYNPMSALNSSFDVVGAAGRTVELFNTCFLCGETDQYVTHRATDFVDGKYIPSFVHHGCCLSCDIGQNIICESCNKTRKPHTLGAKICYACFQANKQECVSCKMILHIYRENRCKECFELWARAMSI